MQPRTFLASGVSLLLAACCSQAVPAKLQHLDTATAPSTKMLPVHVVYAGFSPPQQAKLAEAVSQTEGVFASELFQRKVQMVASASASREGVATEGKAILQSILTQRINVTYVASSKEKDESKTLLDGKNAVTYLGPENVQRWALGEDRKAVVQRACLVATLAHEWSHTVQAEGGVGLFTDDSHRCSEQPVVSYTVGSIAYCSYLESLKTITDGQFWSCVERVGTNVFDASVCRDDAWVGQLKEG